MPPRRLVSLISTKGKTSAEAAAEAVAAIEKHEAWRAEHPEPASTAEQMPPADRDG